MLPETLQKSIKRVDIKKRSSLRTIFEAQARNSKVEKIAGAIVWRNGERNLFLFQSLCEFIGQQRADIDNNVRWKKERREKLGNSEGKSKERKRAI